MVKVEISNQAFKLSEKSHSNTTQRNYASDWRKFEVFCLKEYKSDPLKADDIDSAYAMTINYIRGLHEDQGLIQLKGKSEKQNPKNTKNPYSSKPYRASTIKRIAASIIYTYRINGFGFDRKNPSHEILSKTLRSIIGADKGIESGQAKRLLKKDIKRIIKQMDNDNKGNDDITIIRDKALILVGFYSFCRRSEILGIKKEHIIFKKNSAVIKIPFSKTDQTGEGRWVYIPKKNDKYCAYKAIKKWLEVSQPPDGRFIFYKINKSKRVEYDTVRSSDLTYINLTPANFVLMLKKRAKAAGFSEEDCDKISGHSLRIGAITEARMQNVPIHEIQNQSGHKTTQMIDQYTQISDIEEANAADKI
jgi:integrase|tara:strand:+ start:40 stop:1125 length:1086 start_codon:yes stop_codon:yes gene_type:complete